MTTEDLIRARWPGLRPSVVETLTDIADGLCAKDAAAKRACEPACMRERRQAAYRATGLPREPGGAARVRAELLGAALTALARSERRAA